MMRRVAIVVLGVSSSAFFLTLVLRQVDVAEAWEVLVGTDLSRVLLGAAFIQLVYVCQAIRWRTLAGTGGGIGRFFGLVVAGVGVNNLLPLRVGDLLRARWLAARERTTTGRALGSVFRDRAADVVALMLILLVTLPLAGGAAWATRLAIAGIVFVIVIGAVVVAALAYTRLRPRHRRGTRSLVRSLGRDVLDELSSKLGVGRIIGALCLSVLAWSIWALSAQQVCASLQIGISFPEILFVAAVMNLGVAIPSSPGFVGTYQWLAVSALDVVGAAANSALAFAVVMQLIWFVPTTIVGGTLALRELRNDRFSMRRRRDLVRP